MIVRPSQAYIEYVNRPVHIVPVFLATFTLGYVGASVACCERNRTDSLLLLCTLRIGPDSSDFRTFRVWAMILTAIQC